MSYAEFSDLQFLMPDETILRLSNDDPEATEIDQDVVSALLESASAEIDAAFADGGIKLPLSNNPPAVVELCAILTRCRLYARRPEGYEIPDAVVNACKDARQTLKDIAAGKITLGAKGSEEETAANYIGGFAKTAAPYSLMQDFVDYAYAGMPSIRAATLITDSKDDTSKDDSGSDSGGSSTGGETMADLTNYYTKNETDNLLNAKVGVATLGSYYDKVSVNSLLAQKANATDILSKTELNAAESRITASVKTTAENAVAANSYTKTEINQKLTQKADLATLADYATTAKMNTALADKANAADVYTKAQVDKAHSTLVSDLYNKSEVTALLANKVDTATLTANYTNNTDLKRQLNDKVSSADLTAAVKTRQEEQAALQASVLSTADDLQKQITTMQGKLTESSNTMQTSLTTMQGKLTDASNNMETSLTAMQSSLTSTAESINTRYDELVANVTKVSGELNAKDTALQTDIDAIEALIPSAATANNQLADKAYVSDLVKTSAARAISADADGAGFESLAALKAGPWYSLGESVTPTTNDYAVVKKDATHSGNDVRYNFDGAVWVFFQEFSSGGGSSTLDLTTAQTNALNSGITAALVAKIDTNANGLAVEITDRKNEDTTLLARISTEESTRETADNNLQSAIAAEKLGRENADNQLLAKIEAEALARENADNQLTAQIETESANRGTAINEVKALVNTTQTTLESQIGSVAALNTHTKTSLVEAINDFHTEVHNERLAVDGSNQMTAQLDIVLAGSGDLLLMKAGDKGVNFNLDATTGVMSIIPESARTTGFEVSYNSLKPRTTAVEYSLGDNNNYFTNTYTVNLNGTPVADFLTKADITKEELAQIKENNAATQTALDSKVNKAGDTMTGQLKIKAEGTSDLIHLESGGKGITFTMDSATGFMHLVPVSAPSTGFEFSATAFEPRTTTAEYRLGSSGNRWSNVWANKINDTAVTDFLTKAAVIDMLYPVGSIYLTMDSGFNPNTQWSGTWERLKEGVFLESAVAPNVEKEAGVPNITGYLENYDQTGRVALVTNYGFNPHGCFGWYAGTYNVVSTAITGTSGATAKNNRITFDASQSSAVYGKSDTVQPHSITVVMWQRTA